MKNLLPILFLWPLLSIGQPYFQKNYDFSGGQDEGYDILKEGNDFILYGSGFDTLGKAGIRFIKVDGNGQVIRKKVHTSLYGMGSGVNLIRYGDSLITGGTIFLKHNGQYVRHAMLFFMSRDGDSLGTLTYGDSATTYHYRYIAKTPDSGIVAAGYNYISLGGTDGTSKMVLVKYNKDFAVEWTRVMTTGSGTTVAPNTVTVVGKNIYVGASIFNSSRRPLLRYYTYVRKYSLDGTLLISKNYDYRDGVGGAFIYPAKDGVFLTTYLDSGLVNARPMLYSYMAKLDTNLNVVWKTEIKIPGAVVNFIPKEQPDGSIIGAGFYWEKKYATYTIAKGYLTKYDSMGVRVWERIYEGPTWKDINSFSNFLPNGSDLYILGICVDGTSMESVSMNFWLVKADSNGCISPTTCTDISLEESDVNQIAGLQVYPQPANRILYIKLKTDADDSFQNIRISTVSGTEVYGRKFTESNTTTQAVVVESWPRGIYFLSVTMSDGRVLTKKVLVR